MNSIILASTSPRRKELLNKLGVPFITKSPNLEETYPSHYLPHEIVMTLSEQKAQVVAKDYPKAMVIGSDTMVAIQDKVLGKPNDEADAKKMLRQLSGTKHDVYTGVSIIHPEWSEQFYVKTSVEFWSLSETTIQWYVDSGEPLDKAGAYGIQGKGAVFVKAIEGDYFSVVGLPISRVHQILINKGFYEKSK